MAKMEYREIVSNCKRLPFLCSRLRPMLVSVADAYCYTPAMPTKLRSAERSWLTYVALVIAVLSWGGSFVATKVVLAAIPPAAYMMLRFAIAAVPFGVLLLLRPLPKLRARTHLRLFLLSLFEPGLYFLFETNGLARTSAAKASIVIGTIPIVVAIASRVFLRERMPRRAVIGAVASILGVAVLVLADPAVGVARMAARTGDLFILLAVVAATFYMLLVRAIHEEVSTLHITSLQVLYGTAFFAGFFLVTRPQVSWTALGPSSFVALGFLVVFATIAAFFAYNFALSRITAGQASVALNGVPVVTAVVAWIVLGERLTPLQIAGGVLVLAGVTVANVSKSRREPRSP